MIEIRRATPDDYEVFTALSYEVGEVHIHAMPTIFTTTALPEDTFRALLQGPDSAIMIGFDDGQPVGFITYRLDEQPGSDYFYPQRSLYIEEMGVSQQHRRKGYGEALMNHAVEAAKAFGVDQIALRVWAFNEGARSFYERTGFVPQSIRMVRDLTKD